MELTFRLSSARDPIAVTSTPTQIQTHQGDNVPDTPIAEDSVSDIDAELDLFGDPWPELDNNMQLDGLGVPQLFTNTTNLNATSS
jgi:hypothetical protein